MWSSFRPFWSIARWLYFAQVALETRLKSESFDTLDDLLGFRSQKL